ncbi:MAG: hypothetical protein Q4Q06_03370 [Bacteroidota bacterium]|nr:hypothetical protein [Bacteroidota bacterium]
MKRFIFSLGVLTLMIMGSLSSYAQQGKWAGLVKYKIEWKGNVPQGLPTNWDVKVFENTVSHVDMLTFGQLGNVIINGNNKTVTSTYDFSMLPDEGVTEGMSGKWFVRSKIDGEKLQEVASKIKYEYTGNSKEIAGINCQEVKVISKDEEGAETSELIYVTKELGPTMDLENYPGLDAFPMEYPVEFSAELSATFTVSELQKGKVKDVDVMVDSGYEEISEEDFSDMIRVLFGGGGAEGDEDDM